MKLAPAQPSLILRKRPELAAAPPLSCSGSCHDHECNRNNGQPRQDAGMTHGRGSKCGRGPASLHEGLSRSLTICIGVPRGGWREMIRKLSSDLHKLTERSLSPSRTQFESVPRSTRVKKSQSQPSVNGWGSWTLVTLVAL